jgi:hypothetical protein
MPKRTRDERLQVMLSSDELEVIDDFRFRHRLPSRASTIREILRRGLLALGHELPESRTRSTDFGVIKQVRKSGPVGSPR